MKLSNLLTSLIGITTVFVLLFATTFLPTGQSVLSVKTVMAAGEECGALLNFRQSNFLNPTKINNKYFPLITGTQFTYEGRANRGGGSLPHQVTFTVTDLYKQIDDIKSLVMWDVDVNDGVLSEAELAFFAQDKSGNAWAMGEYPEEYEDGEFVGAPSTWIGGEGSTKAGVHMPANPVVGMTSYHQGISPQIDFYDCAQPVRIVQNVCVPAGCYNNVLVTQEWDPNDPGVVQEKYYAPTVGLIQVGAINDPEGETLVLTKVKKLSSSGLQNARNEALKLDGRGYENSDDYNETSPAKRITQ